jgi:hypothetical protein
MGRERTNFEVTNENKRLAGSSEKIDRLANEAVIKSAPGLKKECRESFRFRSKNATNSNK